MDLGNSDTESLQYREQEELTICARANVSHLEIVVLIESIIKDGAIRKPKPDGGVAISHPENSLRDVAQEVGA